MTKIITAATAALALALASPAGAEPGNRSDREIGNILLGLTVLAIAGAALSDNRDRGTTRPQPQPQPPQHWQHGRHDSNHEPYRPQNTWSRDLPGQCLMGVPTRSGPINLYTTGCMDQFGVRTEFLPTVCERDIDSFGANRNGYDPQCLTRNGFRTAGR